MGFSLVSVFEIVYHMVGAFRKWTMAKYGATTMAATSRTASLNGGPHGESKSQKSVIFWKATLFFLKAGPSPAF